MNDAIQIIVSAVDNASATIKGIADNINGSLGNVGKNIDEMNKSLDGNVGKLQGLFQSVGTGMVKIGGGMDVAGAAILAPLYMMVKAAGDAQDAMTQFNTVIDNVTGSSQAVKDAFLEQAQAFENLGFQSEQTEVALARFYQRTKDVGEATQLTKDAMDLARFKNEDLGTAITQVNMVLSGQGRILSQVGINLKAAGGGAAAMKELEGIIGGSAANASKNFNEEILSLKAHLDDLYVSLGTQLIPLIVRMVEFIKPVIEATVNWIAHHQTLVKWLLIAAAAVGTILVVFGTLIAVMGGVIVVFTTTAGLIAGAVTAAIVALVTAGALLIANWQTVRDFFATMWDEIKYLFQSGWTWINDNVIKPMVAAIDYLISKVANSPLGRAAGAIGGAVSKVSGAIGGALSVIGLAEGGIVTQPTYALIGESGPEAVVPLPGSSGYSGGFGGGNISINVSIDGGLITQDVAKQIGDLIVYQFRRFNKI